MKKKRKSLSVQLTLFVLADLLCCVLAGLVINIIGEKIIGQYRHSDPHFGPRQEAACYLYLFVGSIICISMIFLSVIFIYTYCKFRYIGLLSQEVHAVEKGELSHSITVKGQDEIAVLADSMENMRHSFAEKILTIEQMQKERNDLVAEMSHDMRTPLTALMMYLDFLKEQKDADEDTRRVYVDKAYAKAGCIKVQAIFGSARARSTTDIDVWIPRAYRSRTRQLLATIGYRRLESPHIWATNQEIVYHDVLAPIEIHWRLALPALGAPDFGGAYVR